MSLGQANRDQPGTVGWMYVPYPSTYGVGLLADVPTYQDSVAAGVASANRILDEKKAQCGAATRFVLLGYSVGAEITERVARDIGHRDASAAVTADDIAGVALVGDPYRPAGTPSLGESGPAGGGFMASEPADYGALAGRILYDCRPMDIACDAPPDIALLELALGVLGQVRFTIVNPVQTFADFGRVASDMSARAIAHIVTREDWFTSDESLLDVLRTVADQTYRDDAAMAAATPERIAALDAWARGPGADVVRAKLGAEGAGFLEDNRGIVDLIVKPYLFLGPLQHVLYWLPAPHHSSATANELPSGSTDCHAVAPRRRKGRHSEWSGAPSCLVSNDLLRDRHVDGVDAGAVRGDRHVAVAGARQGTDLPGAGCGEEAEVAGRGRDDLGGELVGAVEQADERATHRLAVSGQHAAGDDGFLLDVHARGQGLGLNRCSAHFPYAPNSIGAPTSEPYSTQLPS